MENTKFIDVFVPDDVIFPYPIPTHPIPGDEPWDFIDMWE